MFCRLVAVERQPFYYAAVVSFVLLMLINFALAAELIFAVVFSVYGSVTIVPLLLGYWVGWHIQSSV